MSLTLFWVFGGLAVLAALGTVLNVRNTVAGVLSLAAAMVSLGAVYVLLEAAFVAVVQLLVTAGAAVVLFVVVVMLVDPEQDARGAPRQSALKITGAVLVLFALANFVLWLPVLGPGPVLPTGFGGYEVVGALLFTDWVLAFESVGLLLLAAMVGSVVLAKGG